MEIRSSNVGGVLRIEMNGVYDVSQVLKLEEKHLKNSGAKQCEIHLRGVNFVDSTFIGTLLMVMDRYCPKLAIFSDSDIIVKSLKMAQLDRIMQVTHTA
ncbi:STAS domain-containing protein [Magnetofaba australis]|nr:STAS domain-containing protein [Magnetofaba australis]